MLQQRGQMRVTKVVFFESPYQLIVKYFLISCKLCFFIFCNNVCFVKKVVRELMKKMTLGRAGMAAMATMAATVGVQQWQQWQQQQQWQQKHAMMGRAGAAATEATAVAAA